MTNEKYRHSIEETVRFHEVDMLCVMNNAVYFNYFEDARLKYIQHIQSHYELKEFLHGDSFLIMARNECDYIQPARLDEVLIIDTRIEYVRNSSFGLRHLVRNKKTGKIIAKGGGVFVHINRNTLKPMPLQEEFYAAVMDYEEEVRIERRA